MKLVLIFFVLFFAIKTHSQTITTKAGSTNSFSGGDGGQFSAATFSGAGRMVYDRAGNLYIADRRAGRIRKVDAVTGIITTFVSGFSTPLGMAFDPQEKFMYVAENFCIYRINMVTKSVSVFAGKPGELCSAFFLCGEGGLAVNAVLDNPAGVAVDSVGNVYIADNGNTRVRRVDIVTGIITTYAGGGGCNCVGLGDGGPANKSTLLFPSDVHFDNQGNLIISDGGLHNIRKVDSKTGIISTIAGGVQGGAWGYSGDGGPAGNSRLNGPSGIFIDKNDNIYIGEAGNHVIRKIDKAGIITTIAGNGTMGYSGDCGPADKAQLNEPIHAVVTPAGSILIGDYRNNVFREIVNAAPNSVSAATNSLCVNTTLQLTNAATGGVWQSSNPAVAKVSSGGVVTGLTPGTVNISYYISNGCNTNSSSITITVNSTPVTGPINGSSNICEAGSSSFNNVVAGGVWSTSDSSIAVANTSGLVKGISAGTAFIKYELSNGSCTSMDSIKVTVNPLPKIQPITGDTTVCVNSFTALNNVVTGGTWSTSNKQIADVAAATGVVKAISAGNALITYTITNTCGSAAIQSSLEVNPLPSFYLGNDTAICLNSKLTLQPGINNVTYQWENGSADNNHILSEPGLYWLKIIDSNQCFFADSINIENKPLPFLYLSNDTTICNNLVYNIDVSNTLLQNYKWQDGSTSPVFNIIKQGQYIAEVTAYNGCKNSDTINVSYLNSPVINLDNSETICPGAQVIIDPKLNNATYLWQDGSTQPTFTVKQAGVYSLTATNACGSTSATTKIINGVCRLFMPDAFTPNNDGLNDLFRVKYPQFIKTYHLTIFNRWGQKIFETTNPNQGWNGRLNSIDQNPGNYIWAMTFTDLQGKVENARGSVLLIR